MTLWHLERVGRIGWDEVEEFVIRADSEDEARALASAAAGDEGKEIWRGSAVVCKEIEADGPKEIICRAYRSA